MYGNRTNIPTSLGQANSKIAAARNQTKCLAWHWAATQTQADWNSVRRNPGVSTTPGWNLGIVRTLCRQFRAFRWFPIHKPSSNSTILVTWITKPAADSRSNLNILWSPAFISQISWYEFDNFHLDPRVSKLMTSRTNWVSIWQIECSPQLTF